eukprot:61338_1
MSNTELIPKVLLLYSNQKKWKWFRKYEHEMKIIINNCGSDPIKAQKVMQYNQSLPNICIRLDIVQLLTSFLKTTSSSSQNEITAAHNSFRDLCEIYYCIEDAIDSGFFPPKNRHANNNNNNNTNFNINNNKQHLDNVNNQNKNKSPPQQHNRTNIQYNKQQKNDDIKFNQEKKIYNNKLMSECFSDKTNNIMQFHKAMSKKK